MKRSTSLSVISISLAALAAIAIAALLVWHQLGTAGASVDTSQNVGFRPAIEIGGPFSLVDHTGAKVTEESFSGKYMLITFGYTFCPDICPTGLTKMSSALNKLGKNASKVQPIFVTVDPARDTAKALSDYVTHFHPSFKGLTGNAEQIDKIAKAYHVLYRKAESGDSTEYLMDHTTFVYLMNPTGKLSMMFRYETDPADMANAIAKEITGKS